jgi:hypothetical protein
MDKDLKGEEYYYSFGIRQEIRVDPAEHATMLPNGPSLQPEHKMSADGQSRFYKTHEKLSVACEIEVNGLGFNEQCVIGQLMGTDYAKTKCNILSAH